MTEEDALIAGIAANPLDDLRRLVYADWLDERGQPEEAEYLRLVAALAAPGEAVDVTHPHAVRLVALVDGIDHTWRTATGGRFSLWFDAFVPPHKIRFVTRLRAAYGTGLAEGKGYSESLPLLFDNTAPLEVLIQKVNTLGDAAIARIVPDSQLGSTCGPMQRVVLSYQVWVDESQRPESLPNALEHMRRTLSSHAGLSHHLASLPDPLAELAGGAESGGRTYWFTLTSNLTLGSADRLAMRWREALLGGKSLSGSKADPPFVGGVAVWATPETDPS